MALHTFLRELLPEVIGSDFVFRTSVSYPLLDGFEHRFTEGAWSYLVLNAELEEEFFIRNWHFFGDTSACNRLLQRRFSFSFIRDFIAPSRWVGSSSLWSYSSLRNEELAICLSIKGERLEEDTILYTDLAKYRCQFRETLFREKALRLSWERAQEFSECETFRSQFTALFFEQPWHFLPEPGFAFVLRYARRNDRDAFVARYAEALSPKYWRVVAGHTPVTELESFQRYCPDIFALAELKHENNKIDLHRRIGQLRKIEDFRLSVARLPPRQGALVGLSMKNLHILLTCDEKWCHEYFEEAFNLMTAGREATEREMCSYLRQNMPVSFDFALRHENALSREFYEDFSFEEIEKLLELSSCPHDLASKLSVEGLTEQEARLYARYAPKNVEPPKECSEAFFEEFFLYFSRHVIRVPASPSDAYIRRHWEDFGKEEKQKCLLRTPSSELLWELAKDVDENLLNSVALNPYMTVNFARRLHRAFPSLDTVLFFQNEWTKQREIEENVELLNETIEVTDEADSLVIAVLTITRDVEEVIVAERRMLR